MKKILLLLLMSSINCVAQDAPSLEWIRVIGGQAGEDASSIITTTDGGYIIAGHSHSESIIGPGEGPGYTDLYIIKFNEDGIVQWETAIGGSASDMAETIIQTADGGYMIGGTTFSNDGDAVADTMSPDAWLVKINSTGQIVWQKHHGTYSGLEETRAMAQTPDGGFIMAGLISNPGEGEMPEYHGDYDYFVVKTDADGNLEWQRSLGGTNNDQARTVVPVTGGYIVAGYTMSSDGDVTTMAGCYDSWFVKLDLEGNTLWQKSIGESGCEMPEEMMATPDGGLVYVGTKSSNMWIVKTDADANIEWQEVYGGSSVDEGHTIDMTSDGGYVISGRVSVADGTFADVPGTGNVFVLKLDSGGQLKWQQRFGGTNDQQWVYSIKEVSPEEYVMCGGTYATDGDMADNHGWIDLFVAKLSHESLAVENFTSGKASIYPNPASTLLTIKLPGDATADIVAIIDTTGKVIIRGENTNTINVEGLTAGIYLLDISSGGTTYREKLVVE